MLINVAANMKAQVRYHGTMGEGVEQPTFSSCGETMANDLRTINATTREDECFGIRVVFETSSGEGTILIEACVI